MNPIKDFIAVSIGYGGDMSIKIDKDIEDIYLEYFLPFACVYSEECGKVGDERYQIILDPLDGSDNLVSHFPYYGASIALSFDSKVIAAIVVNFVNNDFLYRQEGGTLQQGNLFSKEMTACVQNKQAKVGIFEKSALYVQIIEKLIKNKLKFRSPGAVALSIAYAYNVNYVIFIGQKRVFDVSAGLFLVEALPRYEDDGAIIIAQDIALLEKIKSVVIEDR